MNYTDAAIRVLNGLQNLGKQKVLKNISNNLKGEMFALLLLYLSEAPLSPGELGNAMEISSARVAALLNALEKKEQIIREIDPNDRRKIVVRLTEKGEETALICRECSVKHISLLMESLGEEDVENLIRIIDKITGFVTEIDKYHQIEEETVNVI